MQQCVCVLQSNEAPKGRISGVFCVHRGVLREGINALNEHLASLGQIVEDLASIVNLARLDTLITVLNATTAMEDLEGGQMLKVGTQGILGALLAFVAWFQRRLRRLITTFSSLDLATSTLPQDHMAEAGHEIPDEDCVDDRRVSETLIELVEYADLVLINRDASCWVGVGGHASDGVRMIPFLTADVCSLATLFKHRTRRTSEWSSWWSLLIPALAFSQCSRETLSQGKF